MVTRSFVEKTQRVYLSQIKADSCYTSVQLRHLAFVTFFVFVFDFILISFSISFSFSSHCNTDEYSCSVSYTSCRRHLRVPCGCVFFIFLYFLHYRSGARYSPGLLPFRSEYAAKTQEMKAYASKRWLPVSYTVGCLLLVFYVFPNFFRWESAPPQLCL